MVLFRPVGLAELELIAASGWRAFPPRLAHQPIFYPVLNRGYAEEIARDWNPTDPASGHIGFVTRFEVDDAYVARFEVKTVGARRHQELWVPAEALGAFNDHLVGRITVEAVFPGPASTGELDPVTGLPRSVVSAAP